MKTISVDAGALAGKQNSQFGTYTFSKELINALVKKKSKQHYRFYLQAKNQDIPAKNRVIIKKKLGWMKFWISFEELIQPASVFLALNQALPVYCPGEKIVFCHGDAPYFFPKLYPNDHQRINSQIKQMFKKANLIIVGSKKLKNSLTDIYRQEQGSTKNMPKIKIINYGLSEQFLSYQPQKRQPYLLFVGSSTPVKNLNLILAAFKQLLNLPGYNSFKLKLVGVGQHFQVPKELKKQIIIVPYAPKTKLKRIYARASCLVTASFTESFNLPVLEALSQKTPVVSTKSAIIPELKPYVIVCNSLAMDMAKKIKQAITQPKIINLNKLKKQFNWQTYVQELSNLYEQN